MVDNLTFTECLSKLSGYDIITFDVFDTLITRCVVNPTDVFSIVEAQAKRLEITDRGFAQDRRMAEQEGYRVYGETNNLDRIYQLLEEKYRYDPGACRQLKEMELAAELEVVAARERMRALVLALIGQGKRIVLCSDMYLSASDIRRLLVKCGYPADLELWVSNERAASKHSGELWEQLFACLPKDQRIIHVGDNAWSDYRSLRKIGREALLIRSGLRAFEESEMYEYLSFRMTGEIGDSLMLGYLINLACFNSPFAGEVAEEYAVASWMGPALACFADWLVQKRDDSRLLFVTREGYLLKPLYERYCKAAGTPAQENSLFYASRAAAIAAAMISEEEIKEITKLAYEGTLGHFVKKRMNYSLPADSALEDVPISLPAQSKKVMRLLQPYLAEIIAGSERQRTAYRQYVGKIRAGKEPLTVVDVGYRGTIQSALATLLEEEVSGLYMYLNRRNIDKQGKLPADCLRRTTVGNRPIYYNLLFLEAALQAPYGQLQMMTLEDGKVKPVFNEDKSFSDYIPVAQAYFCDYVEWIGRWKNTIGSAMELNFDLAEAIWICLLKFRYLPQELFDAFWLADDFSGNPLWKYDSSSQKWTGRNTTASLVFSLRKRSEENSKKQKVKEWVKRYIPDWAYPLAQKVWVKFIRSDGR